VLKEVSMSHAKRSLVLLLGIILLGGSLSWAGEASPTEQQKKAQLVLKGGRLWPNYCGNCHEARGPRDRAVEDWGIVMMHMRARANIPADAAEAILEYLKKR
jgi:cytochrome c1